MPEGETPYIETEEGKRSEHLRQHLSDGFWHDDCPYCLRRRRHGGTGLEEEAHV